MEFVCNERTVVGWFGEGCLILRVIVKGKDRSMRGSMGVVAPQGIYW